MVDSRLTPIGYEPNMPGVPVVLADRGQSPPLKKVELGIEVLRFEVRADGAVEVELVGTNYGYAENVFSYRVRKEFGR